MGPPPGKWLGKVRGLNLPPFTATLSLLQGGIKDLLNGMILQVTVLPHPKKKGLKKKGLKKRDEPVGWKSPFASKFEYTPRKHPKT